MRLRTADIYGGMIPSRLQEDEALPALAQSIARHGLLQPIVVQENLANGRYMLVCGARRLAACRMLGLEEIDAVNIPGDKPDAVACFLEEHFTRKGVSFLEEARLLSRDDAAQKCCMPEGEMRRRLSMLELDAQTQAAIERGGLSMEQAEWLKGVQPQSRRLEAAEIIAQRGLTTERKLIEEGRSEEQARRLLDRPEETQACGKRRAVRRAAEEAQRLSDALNAQGIPACASMHAQGQGLCIQILLKNERLS